MRLMSSIAAAWRGWRERRLRERIKDLLDQEQQVSMLSGVPAEAIEAAVAKLQRERRALFDRWSAIAVPPRASTTRKDLPPDAVGPGGVTSPSERTER